MYTNNSIKHQSFVYTQLNNQTVLFQTADNFINLTGYNDEKGWFF